MAKTIFLFIFFLPLVAYSQIKNIGTPNISNYTKSAYNAGAQNWGIAQDKNGFIYFANNDGVLIFDGLEWELIKVSNFSPVRSICIDKDNTIYVGLLNDFGILKNDNSGKYTFESLRHLLPPDISDFDDIWKIYDTSFGTVFQSFDNLFVLNKGAIKIIKPTNKFHFSFYVDNRLYLHEPGIGLFEYENGLIHKIKWAENIVNYEIQTILHLKDSDLIIGTTGNGIYKYESGKLKEWNVPINETIKKNNLLSASKIPGKYLAFGTIQNGIVISDYEGNIIQHINRKKGLQNNTVLSVFSDKDENLWLGLDNGIDYFETNSPLSFITDIESLGAGYCCQIFNGKLYLGTNQGLFVKSFSNFLIDDANFELVKNTAGQVWSLGIFDDQLICGHHLGTFLIKNNEATKISEENGAWKYIAIKNHPEYILGGHYNGLVILKNGENGWKEYKKVKDFNESSRCLFQGNDESIWISHGTKGIYQVKLNNALDGVLYLKQYTSADGLPSTENNILYALNNELFVSTINGIYQFNQVSEVFQRSEKLNSLLNINGRIKALETDSFGNIWFISDDESGVLQLTQDNSYSKNIFPFNPLKGNYIKEFEFIYPYNNNNVFIGIEDGFAHYTSNIPKLYSQKYQSFITKVELPYIDSTIYLSNLANPDLEYIFPFRKNSFRFHFSSPFFEAPNRLKFSYFLEDYSENWSDWTPIGFKDFTNLPEGEYVFKVKAKNVYDNESEISMFSFTISPPWHRSGLAYLSYAFLFLILVFILVKFVLYRITVLKRKEKLIHDEKRRKQEEQFRINAIISEKEIIKLRNDKLRAEKVHRDKELANQTMNLIQKNRFLNKLYDELKRIQNTTTDSAVVSKLVLIKERIKKERDDKNQKQLFETYFEDVHDDFFKNLKEKYPQLTPGELKLCAYIRMNIPTKEIATLLNISYRGVEISRYRLRKKLELSRDINLSVFLSGF